MTGGSSSDESIAQSPIGVVGLWHLGCSIAASWTLLGRRVRGVDLDAGVVAGLRNGQPPLYEPRLAQIVSDGLASGRLSFDTNPDSLRGCRVVFLAYDTPVRDDDTTDLSPVLNAIERLAPSLDSGTILVISAQLPVGESRRIRERLQRRDSSLEVVYSPENLRLGEAIQCYLEPGHIVIGADDARAGATIERLFEPMKAHCFRMNLPSAEMVKHCINSFLATSVTLANQWSDIAGAMGADFGDVQQVLRAEPRIGPRAYITPGVGFSGGTLGRDLRVLQSVSESVLGGAAPLFGEVWRYNQRRPEVIAARTAQLVGTVKGARVALLGMTYKPGTSTLRRSLPLAIATSLLRGGAAVAAHDPQADWNEVTPPAGLAIAGTAIEAARDADLAILLTEWPQYKDLDWAQLKGAMRGTTLLDTKGIWRDKREAIAKVGLRLTSLSRTPEEAA